MQLYHSIVRGKLLQQKSSITYLLRVHFSTGVRSLKALRPKRKAVATPLREQQHVVAWRDVGNTSYASKSKDTHVLQVIIA